MAGLRTIHLFFPIERFPTGQESAARLILDLLGESHWCFKVVPLAAFDRATPQVAGRWWTFARGIAAAWWELAKLVFARRPTAYLNLGQSAKSLLCDGLPFYVASVAAPHLRFVVSLHGHFFMEWSRTSLLAKALVKILQRASVVTVLGPSQRERLVAFGVERARVRVIHNTSDRDSEEVADRTECSDPTRVLFLGNLIEKKGYREYLRALEDLSTRYIGPPSVKATLCGDIVRSGLDGQVVARDPDAWIQSILDKINESAHVAAEWLPGRTGAGKWSLFKSAHIFVMPSHTEGQPIALIEAMASGCAIVATRVGEIPYMLGGSGGILVPPRDHNVIAIELLRLLQDPHLRRTLSIAASRRHREAFSRAAYAENWSAIFRELSADC